MGQSLTDQIHEAFGASDLSYWVFTDEQGKLWLAEWDAKARQFVAWPAVRWLEEAPR